MNEMTLLEFLRIKHDAMLAFCDSNNNTKGVKDHFMQMENSINIMHVRSDKP